MATIHVVKNGFPFQFAFKTLWSLFLCRIFSLFKYFPPSPAPVTIGDLWTAMYFVKLWNWQVENWKLTAKLQSPCSCGVFLELPTRTHDLILQSLSNLIFYQLILPQSESCLGALRALLHIPAILSHYIYAWLPLSFSGLCAKLLVKSFL